MARVEIIPYKTFKQKIKLTKEIKNKRVEVMDKYLYISWEEKEC